jgi:serine/threonine protein kinase
LPTTNKQASQRAESEAHAITHKFHVDEKLAERLGLELRDLLSPNDPTTIFKNAHRIGKGGLASVFQATNIVSGEKVALKVMRVTAASFRFMLRELLQHKALSTASCTNSAEVATGTGVVRPGGPDPLAGLVGSDLAVGFRDAYYLSTEGQLWIELEYMDLGALTSLLTPKYWAGAIRAPRSDHPTAEQKKDKRFIKLMPEPVIAYIARRILLGIHWLHRCGRLHRDLKSDK